ncbi:MAG: hypothetical protein V1837_08190 [Candidatus Woesearchaeota archaeon]
MPPVLDSMHMKYRLISVLAIIFFAQTAMAEININLISYNAETQEARILIANTGPQEYSDIVFSIDNSVTEFKGSLLKPGTGFTIPKKVQAGVHQLKVITKEGAVFEQPTLFAKSTVPDNFIVKGKQIQTQQAEEEAKTHWVLPTIIITIIVGILTFIIIKYHDRLLMMLKKPRQQERTSRQPVMQPAARLSGSRVELVRQQKKADREKFFESFKR